MLCPVCAADDVRPVVSGPVVSPTPPALLVSGSVVVLSFSLDKPLTQANATLSFGGVPVVVTPMLSPDGMTATVQYVGVGVVYVALQTHLT